METIFSKLRTITLAAAHALLDKAIDEMSISALKQNMRDLQASIDTLNEEAAVAEGSMNTANGKFIALTAQVEELNSNIDFILGDDDDTNDHLAEPLQARLTVLEKQLASATEETETYRQTMLAVDKVSAALASKLESRQAQIALLESQEKTTSAKNTAAEAIEKANSLMGGSDGSSMDNITEKITRNSHIADARLRRAMGNVQTGIGEDALLQDARAKLAARKAALKSGATK